MNQIAQCDWLPEWARWVGFLHLWQVDGWFNFFSSANQANIQEIIIVLLYITISKKVALVIHDARSMFRSLQCIMGASLIA